MSATTDRPATDPQAPAAEPQAPPAVAVPAVPELSQLATARPAGAPARRPRRPDEVLPALRLVRPSRAARRLGTALLLALLALPVALIFVPWTQTVEGSGQVTGLSPLDREFTVESPIYGRVKRWLVTEGTRVRGPRVEFGATLEPGPAAEPGVAGGAAAAAVAGIHVVPGDLLAKLTNNDPFYIDALVAQLEAVRDKLATAKDQVRYYGEKYRGLTAAYNEAITIAEQEVKIGEQKIDQVANELEIAKVDEQTEKAYLDAYRPASDRGFVPTVQLNEVRRKYLSAQQKRLKADVELEQTKLDLMNKRTKVREVRAKLRSDAAEVQVALQGASAKAAEAQKELVETESKIRNQSTQEVRAPRDGIIKRLLVNEGVQQIKDTDPLAILTPTAPELTVELYLSGIDQPLVHVGDPVRLQFEGWPAIQFPGWPSVAKGTFGGKVHLIDPSVTGAGKFRVLVVPGGEDPWPDRRYLRQGVQARGWVLLREVPLGQELWRRLNAFPPIVAPEEPTAGKDGKRGGMATYGGAKEEKEPKVKTKRPK